MTKAEYDRTRVLPERADNTDIGKAAVVALVESLDKRFEAEWPAEKYAEYKECSHVRYQHLLYMFTKYLIGEEIDEATGHNSAILQTCVLSRGDRNELLFIHNFLNPGAYETMVTIIDAAKTILEETE
jgi:hypothetical protein